jgi:hypothetical protein
VIQKSETINVSLVVVKLARKYYDMMAESQYSATEMRQLLLCNGMVNMFQWQ